MKAENWIRVHEIFPRAARLGGAERRRFLDESCGPDRDLRAELERLLGADERAAGFLETPPAFPLPEVASILLGELPPGTSIAGFRLVRVLGSGGMGTVYEAEQEHPRRRVALKTMKLGLGAPSSARVFQREAEVLARLEHPGIARIYEAGTWRVGAEARELGWFAMEFVEGAADLVTHAERAGLSLRQRLELFLMVCGAVQHGHEKGVIHRDLKPGNILVGSAGAPVVIDFGIARATDADLVVSQLATQGGALVGTLLYMAPEQVAGDERALDTRTDVHSLGLVLYELVCGTKPLALEGLAIPEIARRIREEVPVRPSARRAALAGDLDWILLRSLEKEPARRYATAGELAADIQRHLRHEPVSAGPPGAGYRLRKFARRHRFGVGAAALVALALLGGVLLAGFGLVRARSESARAHAMNAFLAGTFRQMVPGTEGSSVSFASVLERASQALGPAFPGQPGIEASLRVTLGKAYGQLGRFDDAERELRNAVALARSAAGERSQEYLLAAAALGGLLESEGELAEGEALLAGILTDMRDVLGAEHPETLEAMNELAGCLDQTGRADEALRLRQELVEASRRAFGREDPLSVHFLNDLGFTLLELGRFDEALEAIEEGYRIRLAALGLEHPGAMGLAHNLAWVRYKRGELEQAVPLARAVVESRRATVGSSHQSTVISIQNLAEMLAASGELAEAEQLAREALATFERDCGAAGYRTLQAKQKLARLLELEERYAEAAELYSSLLAAAEGALSADNADLLQWRAEHARCLERLGVSAARSGSVPPRAAPAPRRP